MYIPADDMGGTKHSVGPSSTTPAASQAASAGMEGSGEGQRSLGSHRNSFGTLCFLSSPWINSFPLCCHCSTMVHGNILAARSATCPKNALQQLQELHSEQRELLMPFRGNIPSACPCFHMRAERALPGRDVRK